MAEGVPASIGFLTRFVFFEKSRKQYFALLSCFESVVSSFSTLMSDIIFGGAA